jgi:hypothetical protein
MASSSPRPSLSASPSNLTISTNFLFFQRFTQYERDSTEERSFFPLAFPVLFRSRELRPRRDPSDVSFKDGGTAVRERRLLVRRSWGLRPRRVGIPRGGWSLLRFNPTWQTILTGGEPTRRGGAVRPPLERPGSRLHREPENRESEKSRSDQQLNPQSPHCSA